MILLLLFVIVIFRVFVSECLIANIIKEKKLKHCEPLMITIFFGSIIAILYYMALPENKE